MWIPILLFSLPKFYTPSESIWTSLRSPALNNPLYSSKFASSLWVSQLYFLSVYIYMYACLCEYIFCLFQTHIIPNVEWFQTSLRSQMLKIFQGLYSMTWITLTLLFRWTFQDVERKIIFKKKEKKRNIKEGKLPKKSILKIFLIPQDSYL